MALSFLKRFFVFFLCLIMAIALFSQTRETGIIEGKIMDAEGDPLPGVSLTLESKSLMGVRAAVSDQNGNYRFPALPPGVYTITATLDGFTTTKKTNVRLHAGMTITVDIELQPAKLSEEITVIGEAPLIDVKDSALAKTIITTDFFENIPTARNAAQILNYAPGVVEMSAYGGGQHTSNSFQLDGVELNDAWCGSGIYTTPIDYYVIEETQVVSLGAPAEYGNFTGALINIVTKSGGNNFSGDLLLSYQGKNWKSENIDKDDPKWEKIPESPDVRIADASFHLGGPISRDKIWFFGGLEFYSSKTELESKTKDGQSITKVSPVKYPKGFLKLTFQPTERSRIGTFFQYHNRMAEDIGLDPRVHQDAQWDLRYPVYVGNISFLHTFSPSTIFELKLAGYKMEWHSIPASRDKNTPGHVDLATGERYGNSYWWSLWKSNRLQLTASFSHYTENFLAGSHDFKVGLEIERSSGGGDVTINGGFVYYDFNGQPYMALAFDMHEWAINWRYTMYAQDDWKIWESFVLNPGLRVDIYRGSIPELGTLYKPTALEPRIGFSWDIFKDHKTVFKAHYGVYNEVTKSYYISQAKPGMSDMIYYSVPEWGTLIELFRIPAVNRFSVDPNIRHPNMHQFTAGIERVLGKDLSLSLSFIYKDWNNIIEPVNVNGQFEPMSYTDPVTGKTYTVYNQTNPGEDHYLITNPEKGKDIGQAYPDIVSVTPDRKYRAFQISINKRMSNNWQLFLSYVYSHEEGSYPNSHAWGHSFNMGRSDIYYDPNYQINLYGRSSISIPHTFKAQGTFILPLDIALSAFYTYHSGRTWSRRILVPGLNQGARIILAEEAGHRRLPATNNLDLRLEKFFPYKNMKFRLMLDCFNVFNQGRETRVQDIEGDDFGKPLYVNTPRTLLLSLRFMF